jgi:sugar O-acyltransferase (sialic acid O-acetyltransferase NeuD family)
MRDKNKFIIWGSAGHAKVIGDIIYDFGCNIIALFDNAQVKPAIPNVPIYYGIDGFKKWINSNRDNTEVHGAVAIGGDRGKDRLEIVQLFNESGIKTPSLIHRRSIVCRTAVIGEASQILAGAIISTDVEIGKACIVNHKTSVDHECIIGDGVHLAPGTTICGCVKICENAFIGASAVILPRKHIGRNAIVGAGSVVTKDVPENAVVVGNPAKIIRIKDV